MAFVTKVGLFDWPAEGEVIEVYPTGASRTVGNRITELYDVEGGSALILSNGQYTIPPGDFLHITTADNSRVDIWWVDGSRYLVENVIIRSDDIPLLASDPSTPYTGQRWINTTDKRFKIKTSNGTIVIEAYQFIPD